MNPKQKYLISFFFSVKRCHKLEVHSGSNRYSEFKKCFHLIIMWNWQISLICWHFKILQYIHIYIHTYIHIYICVCMCVYIYIYMILLHNFTIYLYNYIQTAVYIPICKCKHRCVCVCVCTFATRSTVLYV